MEIIRDMVLNIRLRDIVDMAIVAIVIYKIFMLIKGTRAEQWLKGVLILLVVTQISKSMELYTIYWILEKTMNYGVIALFIVFQAELRRGLAYIGRTKFFTKSSAYKNVENSSEIVDQIVESIRYLSREKIGALIVFEKQTRLSEIVKTGVSIDGKITSGLLVSIFYPNTPLHDGAVIINRDKVKAAGCFLPLSENYNIKKTLGTRHRAAIGVTETSDCITLVVSEETGIISIAENGKLNRTIDMIALKEKLCDLYSTEDENEGFFSKWRNKYEKNRTEK